ALILVFVAGPIGLEAGWENTNGETVYAVTKGTKAWKELGLWLGAPMMVASGLLSFAFQWRTIVRAFSGFTGGSKAPAAHADVEVPISWFVAGVLFSGTGVVVLAWSYFEVPLLLGVLAVVLTFFLALVAARATGESDITPTGAMGKIMQLTYGVLIPQSATANLMTAGITAGAAGASADLLNDLKSGYLLGANPRRQFIAQGMGIFSGTVATVTGFYLLVPDATALNGTDTSPPDFPAPAAQAWRAVAEVFRDGIGNMHPMHQKAIVIGLVVGAILVIAENMLPKYKKYLPSATGLGLGFILPFQYPLSMLVGAIITAVWSGKWPENATDYVVPIASGVIAGVSIIGVIVAMMNNLVL
ncbi:MAG: putative oligopeptide transporter (OPT) family protein, partial [Myxococcota bacterium]